MNNKHLKNDIKGFIRFIFQKCTGYDTKFELYEDRINTLNFFLNHYCDITAFPKADGELGLLQKGDTLLLAIVDKVCRKYNLEYWIDVGTCLGAVRHKGFIPWDDDTDICMMRDTYEKARPILRDELKKYGISAFENKDEPLARIGIGYKHKETGLWIDLLPAEYTTIDVSDSVAVNAYSKHWKSYHEFWLKNRFGMNREKMLGYKSRYIPEICTKEQAKSITYCPEFSTKPYLWKTTEIFPLKPISFEDYELLAPQDLNSYLGKIYGKYMQFPQSGLSHHGDERGKLENWAKVSETNMNDILHELEVILENV